MGGACSAYGVEESRTQCLWGILRERDHLEDAGVSGKIILRRIFRRWNVGYGLDSHFLSITACWT
jgi:hypothetical protein